MSLVIRNGKVFKDKLIEADVLVEHGKIKALGTGLKADEEIDATGKIILPGLIDVHVHFREPGHPHKEDFLTGSMAAAAGGVTTVLTMPNTNPPVTSKETFEKAKKLASKSIVNYGLYIGATPENIGSIDSLGEAVAVKAYVGSTTGDLLLDNAGDFARLLQNTGKLVVVHSEDEELIKYFSGKNKETGKHHLMRDNLAALVSTSRVVLMANYYRKKVHIAHMSTKEEVDFLRQHKKDNVTCEAFPHHLFLTSSFFDKKGSYGKMNPPLRSEADRKALWQGIKEGIIDIIATDHAPHTREEKETEAPCGVPGVQTTLPLMLNEVSKGNLELADVVRLCCENPSRIFGLGRGKIKEGMPADLVIVDMEKEYVIKDEDQFSKCNWTPFHGMKAKGWPVLTMVNGSIVYKDGEITKGKKGVFLHA